MQPGDLAPDFKLADETGTLRSLREFLDNGPVVLFFYPHAMTPGCTAESCHFRDLATEFAEVGAQRIGISPDGVDKQAQFSSINSFDFPLLSDPDGAVASQLGVRRRFGPLLTRRMTFVIDTDFKILEIIKSELRMSVHADKALAALRARA
ncbi:Alkyl hydroperoxide reductase subunit C-like protein [Alloactinosynnema sp. L-07]|uniref:peroxiredoxin n=1 Tax=Alloactinosynnema sp. L-07 TaxID=1653480 RepID=UPI00065EF4FF|nr:peroxiredoxin [Alloactinosynnema sp. L-07]CRK56401.1 Alkyl hydroperoxide reductase subunit C-like protein [Alloactinosynnema sp. L-07]